MTLPALLCSSDFLPGRAPLNGRRWAAQVLFRLWLDGAGAEGLDLLAHDAASVDSFRQAFHREDSDQTIHFRSILAPASLIQNGALFVPDPSIGSWAGWRQSVGDQAFSLIGQIHTLSTTSALSLLDALVYEPVQEWDALICSSSAGRDVVNALIEDRIDQLQHRFGAIQVPRPQLPVIPLPLDESCFAMDPSVGAKAQARRRLGLPQDEPVLLWLGRRSLLTKADLWPTYLVIQRVAERLHKRVWLIECGPDDTTEQGNHFQALHQLCPMVSFLRLGGDAPVSELLKQQALQACDALISLVDNIQETFGLSLAEGMAAGRPVVASNWDGYRDLVRDGIDGFLVASRWDQQAPLASFALGWQQKLGLNEFPFISGTLAQMVQLDLAAAEAAVLTLLSNQALSRAMGAAARCRAQSLFAPQVVMQHYRNLFDDLQQRREGARPTSRTPRPPLRLNPVSCFQGFASQKNEFTRPDVRSEGVPVMVRAQRRPFLDLLKSTLDTPQNVDEEGLLERKHS